jgi:hypothetical protein
VPGACSSSSTWALCSWVHSQQPSGRKPNTLLTPSPTTGPAAPPGPLDPSRLQPLAHSSHCQPRSPLQLRDLQDLDHHHHLAQKTSQQVQLLVSALPAAGLSRQQLPQVCVGLS